jgi:hypothetical protein
MERVVLARVDGILIRSYAPSLFLFLFLSSSRNNLFVLFRRTLCCCVLLFFSCPVLLKKHHFFLYPRSSLWPLVPHARGACCQHTTICLSRICWTCPVSSQWILTLLSQDSFTDSLAGLVGFSRWILSPGSRRILPRASPCIRSRDSRSILAPASRRILVQDWLNSGLSLDSLTGVSPDSDTGLLLHSLTGLSQYSRPGLSPDSLAGFSHGTLSRFAPYWRLAGFSCRIGWIRSRGPRRILLLDWMDSLPGRSPNSHTAHTAFVRSLLAGFPRWTLARVAHGICSLDAVHILLSS